MSSTRTRIAYSVSSSSQEKKIVTKEEIRSIIPSPDSAVVVGGLSMILYEPNNFMHVRLNPSLSRTYKN